MTTTKTKTTQRFTFTVNRDSTSKKAGSNTVSISTNTTTDKYTSNTAILTMTVKEAGALRNFLNETLTIGATDTTGTTTT